MGNLPTKTTKHKEESIRDFQHDAVDDCMEDEKLCDKAQSPPKLDNLDTFSTDLSSKSYLTSDELGTVVTPKSQSFVSKLFPTTPSNQPITYDDVNMSPGIVSIAEAEERIVDDEVLESLEGPINYVVKQCVLFIYSREFFWGKERSERIALVKQCTEFGSCLQRLYRIALADTADMITKSENAFEEFYCFAATIQIFFDPQTKRKTKTFVGNGFPKDPFLRLQESRNCFLIAACVWYTLKLQQDTQKEKQEGAPIDIAKAIRRFHLKDDDSLLNRVVNNDGGNSLQILGTMTGETSSQLWRNLTFSPRSSLSAKANGERALQMLQDFGVGIIRCFSVHDGFKPKRKDKKEGLGYWLFDAVDIDCEGEWVPVLPTNKQKKALASMRKLWKEKWDNNLENKSKKKVERKNLFGPDFQGLPDKSFFEAVPRKSAQPDGTRPGNSPTHAMVVLGGYENKRGKILFFVLNWWAKMPLVVVSADYLYACGCDMYFLDKKLSNNPDIDRTPAQYVESNFPDTGESLADTFWFEDHTMDGKRD